MLALRQFFSPVPGARLESVSAPTADDEPRSFFGGVFGGDRARAEGDGVGLAAGGLSTKPLNLALQGGGAHGAFTWGVLDRLLEDGRCSFGSVSGTSAGAMNAVILADGLMEGGPEVARAKLEAFWRGISEAARFSPLRSGDAFGESKSASASHVWFDVMTRLMSPYQFNPMDYNPLRDLLERSIDFKRLRRQSPVQLFVSATDVADGKTKVFETGELSVDAVLASACLPHIHQAVKVGRRYYWDGGYSSNPSLMPLVRDGVAADTLLVQINPITENTVPTDAQEIAARISRIVFNEPLRREVELIAQCREVANEGIAIGGRLRRRIRGHRFHHIEAASYTEKLGHGSKMSPDWGMLSHLFDCGRAAADGWLKKHYSSVGRRHTVDLTAKFA